MPNQSTPTVRTYYVAAIRGDLTFSVTGGLIGIGNGRVTIEAENAQGESYEQTVTPEEARTYEIGQSFTVEQTVTR